MQTFLPYQNFVECAKVLDYKRLGKQRVEAKQILDIIYFLPPKENRWKNHPAVRMWRNSDIALVGYYNCILAEWIKRGYNNTMQFIPQYRNVWPEDVPWLTEELCLSHRSNLVRKNPEYYIPIFGDIPNDLKYIWPV